MKRQLEKVLRQVIGFSITRTTRASAMECLKFGQQIVVDRQGAIYNIGEFTLHLQCPWRITNGSAILLGSSDVYEPADKTVDFNEDFNWEKAGANMRDAKLQILLSKPLVVEAVEVDTFGGFSLLFKNGMMLSAFPASSSKDEYNEHWRLLDNRPETKQHFVVSNQGLDCQKD